jgi:hypothetical protein
MYGVATGILVSKPILAMGMLLAFFCAVVFWRGAGLAGGRFTVQVAESSLRN